MKSKYIKNVPIILVFSKCDLFEKKIKRVPITVAPCFEDYKGAKDSVEESFAHIKNVFYGKSWDLDLIKACLMVNLLDRKDIEKIANAVHNYSAEGQKIYELHK